jgi:hypothetical protein
MKNNFQLPLFVHITRIPKGSELRGKRLKWFDIWEGHTFQHFLGNKGNEDQEPSKVKLIALILCFMVV